MAKVSYRGKSVVELERIHAAVAVHLYDNDFLDRARARDELEKINNALKNARKRERTKNPGMEPRTQRKYRTNPSESFEQAKDLSERFHGRTARDVTTIQGRIKFNKNVAELGDLEALWILPPTGRKALMIPYDPDKTRLSSNPQGTQLLVVGLSANATKVELEKVPWLEDNEKSKQLVCLGEIFRVDYYTDKHHLEGPDTQKNGSCYGHIFGQESGIRPYLVYDALNKACLITGGAYTVEDIGIVG